MIYLPAELPEADVEFVPPAGRLLVAAVVICAQTPPGGQSQKTPTEPRGSRRLASVKITKSLVAQVERAGDAGRRSRMPGTRSDSSRRIEAEHRCPAIRVDGSGTGWVGFLRLGGGWEVIAGRRHFAEVKTVTQTFH